MQFFPVLKINKDTLQKCVPFGTVIFCKVPLFIEVIIIFAVLNKD